MTIKPSPRDRHLVYFAKSYRYLLLFNKEPQLQTCQLRYSVGRFQKGRRVAPDDRDRRPERHDDRYQHRGPRQHSPSPPKPDSTQEAGSTFYARWSFAARSHDRGPYRMKSE